MKTVLNFNFNYVFIIKANTNKKFPIPTPISTDTYLSDFIDLNGLVTKMDMIRMRDMLSQDEYKK